MNRSEQINELAAALAKAQAAIEGASKDKDNPFFKSKYADLESVWAACRDPLCANGLAVCQCPETDGETVVIETVLMHSSGQWIASRLSLPPQKNDPQAIGSAITYGRRYALSAMVGVAPEDDDAEGAMNRNGRKSEPKKQEAKKPAMLSDDTINAAMEKIKSAPDNATVAKAVQWVSEHKPRMTPDQFDAFTKATGDRLNALKDEGAEEPAGVA